MLKHQGQNFFNIERSGIDYYGILCLAQWGVLAGLIRTIALDNLGDGLLQRNVLAVLTQLRIASPSSLLISCMKKKLHMCVRKHFGADIASFEDDPGFTAIFSHTPLQLHQRLTHYG